MESNLRGTEAHDAAISLGNWQKRGQTIDPDLVLQDRPSPYEPSNHFDLTVSKLAPTPLTSFQNNRLFGLCCSAHFLRFSFLGIGPVGLICDVDFSGWSPPLPPWRDLVTAIAHQLATDPNTVVRIRAKRNDSGPFTSARMWIIGFPRWTSLGTFQLFQAGDTSVSSYRA